MSGKRKKRIRKEERKKYEDEHLKWTLREPPKLFFISHKKWKKNEPVCKHYKLK